MSTAFSTSFTVAQSFLAPKVKRMMQGSYRNDGGYISDMIRQRELDQEQLRITMSGSQRTLSGVLQEGVLKEAVRNGLSPSRLFLVLSV